jgi:hypothetical protein
MNANACPSADAVQPVTEECEAFLLEAAMIAFQKKR